MIDRIEKISKKWRAGLVPQLALKFGASRANGAGLVVNHFSEAGLRATIFKLLQEASGWVNLGPHQSCGGPRTAARAGSWARGPRPGSLWQAADRALAQE